MAFLPAFLAVHSLRSDSSVHRSVVGVGSDPASGVMVVNMGVDAVVLTARAHQGTVTWGQLVARHPRRTVAAAVRSGLLTRVGRGVLVVPGTPDPLKQALVHRGVVSHESAARLWFMETLHEPTATHVTVGRNARGLAPRGTRLHWTHLDDHEVRGRVATPLRTVVDCARTLPCADPLAIADSALRRRTIEPDELVRATGLVTGLGAVAARRVAAAADARAANPFESGLRAVVIERGVAGFTPQLPFRPPRLRGFVDLGDPVRRVVLEADSFAHHGGRPALDRDCRRYDELVRTGWLVLRFSWEQVMYDRQWVGDCVAETVGLRPAVPKGRNRAGRRPAIAL